MERYNNSNPLLVLCAIFLFVAMAVVTTTAGFIIYHRTTILNSPITQATLGAPATLERRRCTWMEDIKHLDTGAEQLLCHIEKEPEPTSISDLPVLGEPDPGIKLKKQEEPHD